MGAVIRSYIDDPDKLFESGETLANTALTLTTLLFEGPVATAAGIALPVEMAGIMWNSPELIHYSDNKEDVAYDSGKVIGGMLLVAAIFKGAQNAINALKSDIHVQYMVNGAKLQMQGILSKSDTLAALAGKISGILKCVEGSFTAEAMAYMEQYLTAEKGSRFLEAVRKLEKELGDKMPQLDTAKAKRIVESLDDGKSVDDVVAELKSLCEETTIHISEQRMYQIGKHFHKHGRDMGYVSKREYEAGAREFYYNNVDTAEIYQGKWTSSSGNQKQQIQIVIRANGKQLIINRETGQIIDFYIGTDSWGLIDLERIQ